MLLLRRLLLLLLLLLLLRGALLCLKRRRLPAEALGQCRSYAEIAELVPAAKVWRRKEKMLWSLQAEQAFLLALCREHGRALSAGQLASGSRRAALPARPAAHQ